MRIRLPFAGAFFSLLLASAYLGLSSLHLEPYLNDKAAHALLFFFLTTCFYWILDTTRRRNLNITLVVCTGVLGIGSEIVQGLLPNERVFDVYDIAANVAGSLAALALSTWYHKRMLERKRAAKQYAIIPGDEEQDLELGEGVGAQESGVIERDISSGAGVTAAHPSLEAEVDNWDENVEDAWDEEHADSAEGDGPKTPSASSAGEAEHLPVKKRAD